MKKIKIITVLFIIFIGIIVFKSNIVKKEKTLKNIGVVEKVVPVKTVYPEIENVTDKLLFTGDVKGQEEALIYSRVEGKLIENKVKEGDYVKKGDIIALVDRDLVGYEYKPASVESHLTGIVGRVYLDKGEDIEEDTPVAFISDMEKVKVDLYIPEEDMSKVKRGMDVLVSVDAYPNEVFKGKIDVLSPIVEIKTRKFLTETVIDNKDFRLRSGMFAVCNIVVEERKNVMVVDKEAILNRKDHEADVFVNEKGLAKLKHIKLGIVSGDKVEVISGISKSNEVITLGNKNIKDGSKIYVEKKG
jgi:membrane fusion protein, multidrug efflux system